jgi:cytochrome c oxidase subunit 3/cytochrome o ubiquinol oxidase subunit 3
MIDAPLAHEMAPPPVVQPEHALTARQYGMLSFLVSEVAIFSTLIVTYLFYLGKDTVGPTPAESLSLSLVLCTTACLLASSAAIHKAESTLEQGRQQRFLGWWLATIVLGALFLVGTAYEWHELITRHNLTIGRNLFGTTYYTLVGLHAIHVTVGVVVMLIVFGLAAFGHVTRNNRSGVQLVGWYWHFVDVVWLVVFTVVYLVGR